MPPALRLARPCSLVEVEQLCSFEPFPVDDEGRLGLPDRRVLAYGRALEAGLVCEEAARAECDRGERVVGDDDVQAQLLLQTLGQAAEERAAARQYQPGLVDVRRHLRLR